MNVFQDNALVCLIVLSIVIVILLIATICMLWHLFQVIDRNRHKADCAVESNKITLDRCILKLGEIAANIAHQRRTTESQAASPPPVVTIADKGQAEITSEQIDKLREVKNYLGEAIKTINTMHGGKSAGGLIATGAIFCASDLLNAVIQAHSPASTPSPAQQPEPQPVRLSLHDDIVTTLGRLEADLAKIVNMRTMPNERHVVIRDTLVSVLSIVRDLNRVVESMQPKRTERQ